MESTILSETIDQIKMILGKELNEIKVDRIVFGLFFTGVKLSTGDGGVSYTPIKSLSYAVCCPSQASSMPMAGNLRGRSVLDFINYMNGNSLKRTLGLAVINALSSLIYKRNLIRIDLEMGKDPFDKLNIKKGKKSVVIGALVPYLKYFIKNEEDFSVLELDKSSLKGKELDYFVKSPSDLADQKISEADYIIITGTTLINDTIDGIISKAKSDSEIIVVGPTVSMISDPMFKRNISHIGGVLVTEPDELLDIISEGGSGYHFFGKYAEKFTISKRNLL